MSVGLFSASMLQMTTDFLGAGPGAMLPAAAAIVGLFALARPLPPAPLWMRFGLVLPAIAIVFLNDLMMTVTHGLFALAGSTSEAPTVMAVLLVVASWPTIRLATTAILPNQRGVGPLFFIVGLACATLASEPLTWLMFTAALLCWADTVPAPERGWSRPARPLSIAWVLSAFVVGLWLSKGWITVRTVFEPSIAGLMAVTTGVAVAQLLRRDIPIFLWAGLAGTALWLLPHSLAQIAPIIAVTATQGVWGISGSAWLLLPLFILGLTVGPLMHFGSTRSRMAPLALCLGIWVGPWVATIDTIGWISLALLALGATFANRYSMRLVYILGATGTFVLLNWMGASDNLPSRTAVWSSAHNPMRLHRWLIGPKDLDPSVHGQTESGSFIAWSNDDDIGLTLDGVTSLSQGRQAAAEELSGHLGVLLAPTREPLFILGDWSANALRAISAYPKGLAHISAPNAEGLRAIARKNKIRERLWLQPNHALYAEHPARLVQRMTPVPAILEISRTPWTDGVNWGFNDTHIDAIKKRLTPDGIYVFCVHLRWWPDGSIPDISRALTDHFTHVKIWMPPEGADSLIFTATDQPIDPSQVNARFGSAKAALSTLGYPSVDSLLGAAVLGTDAVNAIGKTAKRITHTTRLPPSILSKPVLHVAQFPAQMNQYPDPWLGRGNAAVSGVRKARGTVIEMIAQATRGELEGAFQAAQALSSQHGDLGKSALEALIEPHINDGQKALQNAIKGGPNAPAWDDAARFATTAKMLAPKSHIPATLLGDIALAKGLAPKALEQYQFALSADPTHIPALEGLAKWARLTGDSTKAEQALRSGTRHGPRNWRTWHNLGVFFMEENRVAEALDSLETALGLAPLGEPAPLIALITAQLRDGQSGAALLRAEQLTKTAPEKAMAWFLRGRSHYDLNRLNEAEEDFRKAVLIDPDLIEARSGIGLVRATQGDTDSAVRIFRDVLKRDPDNLAARENLRRLGTIGAPSP